MNEFDDLPIGDERERPLKENEYRIKSVGVGKIICSRPGVQLIDFYRTPCVLVKDIPVRGAEPVTTEPSDAKVVVGRTVGATPATGATQ